jgi:tetratricopeptide (TPR) repeat protein
MTNEVNYLDHAALNDARQRVRRSQWMIEEIERSLRLVPNDADRHYGQALAFLLLGRIQEAHRSLNSAVDADADHLPALTLMGETLLKLGEYKKAASVLERLLHHEPDNMTAITGLCLAYHCLDKKGKELSRDSILQTIAPDLLATSLKT